MQRIFRRFLDVEFEIPQASLLLWRHNARLRDRLIANTGRSEWKHAATAYLNGTTVESLEFDQRRGASRTPLGLQVLSNPGVIDVFEPNPDRFWTYDADRSIAKMLELLDRYPGRYGWWNLLRATWGHMLSGILWGEPITDDADDDCNGLPPFCSQARALADRYAGKDPVPNLASRLVEPGDLGRSLLYADGYLFTLVP